MSTKIKEKVEELSLLAVLLDESDESTLESALEVCKEIKELAKTDETHGRLLIAVHTVLGTQFSLDLPTFLESIKDFTCAAQNYLVTPETVIFANEASEAPVNQDWGDDLDGDLDEELLSEFVAQYDQTLDEFEGEILSNEYEASESKVGKDLTSFVKGYLHTLKGDSGTVGFHGVARVTHVVEDVLTKHEVEDVVEQLLSYKTWVLSCTKAWTEGGAPKELSADFTKRLLASVADASSPLDETNDIQPQEDKQQNTTYKIEGDSDILAEFTVEAEDHLNAVEEVLLEEGDELDSSTVDTIFRSIHSVKGGAAFFNLRDITETSHVSETVLDRVRKDEVPLNKELRGLLLTYIDLQKELFSAAREAMNVDGTLTTSDKAADYLKEINKFTVEGESAAESCAKTNEQSTSEQNDTFVTSEEQDVPEKASPSIQKAKKSDKSEVKTFVKVETARLDKLIEYIGEMMISSSMLIKHSRDLLSEHEMVQKNAHQFELISRELQGIGMSMRLIPIKGVLQKMSRLVWDTSKKIGKDVAFEMNGEDTELDRAVIDKLADPLMHMVRNSVDHGVEPPQERIKNGKPAKGLVKISAFHLGGNIHIEIRDDGRGMDPEILLKKAIEKGVVSQHEKLSKDEIFQLVFAPGFSTAAKITDVSGRGVGMDVVKRNIESMRGRIRVNSKLGEGSVFTIELPLTLAIVDGVETRVGNEGFIIPTLSLVEFLKPTPEMIKQPFGTDETLAFRGKFIPVLRLYKLYDIPPTHSNPFDGIIAVVTNAGREVALMLDEVIGTYSTVIKSLGQTFRDVKGLAGCAVMPDGYIGLILDIGTLVDLAHSIKQQNGSTLGTLTERVQTEQQLSA